MFLVIMYLENDTDAVLYALLIFVFVNRNRFSLTHIFLSNQTKSIFICTACFTSNVKEGIPYAQNCT